MSKDEVSDLDSLINRLILCELECQRAQFVKDEAARHLATFKNQILFKYQMSKDQGTK